MIRIRSSDCSATSVSRARYLVNLSRFRPFPQSVAPIPPRGKYNPYLLIQPLSEEMINNHWIESADSRS